VAVAVTLDKVSAGYRGAPVLHDITLSIRSGERVAVIGRSGAGKSTLLNTIYRRYREHAALIPQASALVANLSVFHNVFMGCLDRHSTLYNLRTLVWPPAAEIAAVARVLDAVGLEEKLFAKAGELSGGQQQRTSVARAMLNGRPIIVADEPVSALDRVQGGDVLRVLAERHETKIFAMHDIRLALEHCDRIVLLERGRMILDELSSHLSFERLRPHFEGELPQ
jgi:phosphonate transport system ATP-binding protein